MVDEFSMLLCWARIVQGIPTLSLMQPDFTRTVIVQIFMFQAAMLAGIVALAMLEKQYY